MPLAIRFGMRLVWAGTGQSKLVATREVKRLLERATKSEGKKYDSTKDPLPTIERFCRDYHIKVEDLLISDLTLYPSMNAFFYRKLKPGLRPQAEPDNPLCITSAADCRLTVYETVASAKKFWIKGEHFSIPELLQDDRLAANLEDGELCIFRLAPADYHRFHSPIDAVVGKTKLIEGAYYTVNPAAVNENLDVFTSNHRAVTILSQHRAGTHLEAAFISIGAMLVGSVNITPEKGATIHRGDELGYFAYGGSTCICIFPKGVVKWDDDLLTNSTKPLETLVKVRFRPFLELNDYL
ncbi:hypothetical protein T439DRAFT_317484 [Meredithblackwellia eburnea MCA 4105]